MLISTNNIHYCYVTDKGCVRILQAMLCLIINRTESVRGWRKDDVTPLSKHISSPIKAFCLRNIYLFNDTELYCTKDAVHLGHHISFVNKASLVADATAKFWRGYNMFMADFGHIKTNVKGNLFKQFAALIMEPHYGIFRVRVLALFALHGEKRLESCGG